jgi:hypothetical protein
MGKKKVGNPLEFPPQARTETFKLSPVRDGSRGKGALITLDHGNPPFYFEFMPAHMEFRSLSLAKRLQLIEAIWDSIVEDRKKALVKKERRTWARKSF